MLWDRSTPLLSVVVGVLLWLWTAALLLLSGWLACQSLARARRQLCSRKKIDYNSARTWLRSLGITSRDCGSDSDELVLQAQVEAIADSQRLERVSSALKLGAFAIPLSIMRNVGIAHDLFKADDNEYLLYRSEFFFVVFLELMAVIFFLRPATLSKRSLQVSYAILMVRNLFDAIIEIQTPDSGEGVVSILPDEYRIVFTQLTRLWFGLLLQNIQCTVALHLLVVPANLAVHALLQEEKIMQLIVFEVLFGTLVCLACAMVERGSRAAIAANLEAQSAKALEGAAASMLSSICDAVVHLSAALHIKERCQRLSILLMKDPSVDWRGKCFGDLFLSADDVAAFKSFIEKAPGNDSLARTMHATLCDAHGAPVLVQFFHATCLSLDGSHVHIVGIRDAGGERIGPAPASVTSTAASNDAANPPEAIVGALRTISESSFSSGSTAASAIPMEMSTPYDDSSVVKVWVGIRASSLPILKYTHALVSTVGAKVARQGADLLDIAASPRGDRPLLEKLQALINMLLHEDTETPVNLKLELSTRRSGTILVDTSVEMDDDSEDFLEASVENSETDMDFNVVIRFNSFQVLGTKSRRRSRSRTAKKAAPPPPCAAGMEVAGRSGKRLLSL